MKSIGKYHGLVNRNGMFCYFSIIFYILLVLPPGLLSQSAKGINNLNDQGKVLSLTEDGVVNHKCGFPQVLQTVLSQNKELNKYLTQQIELDSVYHSTSGHFIIHYDVTGPYAIPDYDRNQNGTKDYLEFVSNSFDRAWQIEIDSLEFKPPPDSAGLNRNTYHVYCFPLGYLYPDNPFGSTVLDYEIPSLTGLNYVTHIDLNVDFSFASYLNEDPIVRDSMAIAVTAAHEFNHALQCGYRLWPDNNYFYDIWFIESSATFMEEVVAPQVNDYLNYLPWYFNRTRLPLDQSLRDLTDYGKVVVEIMLGELYGADITRKIWTNIQQERALPAMEKVLISEGTALSREMVNLATWLYYTGADRSIPGQFFPDAPLFPDPDFIPADPILSKNQIVLQDSLPRWAFQWYVSPYQTPQSISALLEVSEGSSAANLSAVYIDMISNEYYQIPASTSFEIPFQSIPDYLPVAVVSTSSEAGLQSFRLLSRPQVAAGSSEIVVFPQPFVLSEHQAYLTFKNIPPLAQLFIFSSNGKHLQTLQNDSQLPYVYWDLTTNQGKTVGSGVYLYRVKTDNKENNGKFIVIR
jgi:hypothetical protein